MAGPVRKNPFAAVIEQACRQRDAFTIYVSGPVSAHEDLNIGAFLEARRRLQAAGYRVIIPHDVVTAGAPWLNAMTECIAVMATADGVAVLDGWQDSDGAKIEVVLADRGGLPVATVDEWCKGLDDSVMAPLGKVVDFVDPREGGQNA